MTDDSLTRGLLILAGLGLLAALGVAGLIWLAEHLPEGRDHDDHR